MSTPISFEPFPDLEAGLVAWARNQTDLLTGANTETPTDWPAGVKFLRVTDLGGFGNGVDETHQVVLDLFASTRSTASTTLRQVVARIVPRLRVGSAMIDLVTTRVSPRELPWDNAKIKRFNATLVITTRR